MRKLFLFLIFASSLFSQDTINVATEDYGAITNKAKNSVEIKLPVETNVEEIQLFFKPNKGKIVILKKDGKNEKEVASVVLSGKEEEAKFKLQKLFLKDVRIIFVPEDDTKPLLLSNYALNVVDTKAIQLYTSIQRVNLKETSAGASAPEPSPFTAPVVPATLPTEFTISRSSL